MELPDADRSGLKRKRSSANTQAAPNAQVALPDVLPGLSMSSESGGPQQAALSQNLDLPTEHRAPTAKKRKTAGKTPDAADRDKSRVGPSNQSMSERESVQTSNDPIHVSDTAVGHGSNTSMRSMSTQELDRFRESVTANFSTRILYKHNELRLIDQEIAKCQVALEQLRRCSEIPYPSLTGISDDMEKTSTGSGPALVDMRQKHPAVSPAPWGVADGPYTRHYSQWLLPDPLFDGGQSAPPIALMQSTSDGVNRLRVSQGGSENVLTSSRSRGQRGSTNAVLQSLPSGYAQPKPERSAQIIKRQSDGMFVKLVCPGPGCGEERFNSVQGFINHCRIKHQIHFATHEDAAQRAGTTEDVEQNAGVAASVGWHQPPTQERLPPVTGRPVNPFMEHQPTSVQQTSSVERVHADRRKSIDTLQPLSPTTTRTAAPSISIASTNEHKPRSGPTLTHPYNRPGLDSVREWPEQRQKPPLNASSSVPQGDRQRRQSNMGPPISPAFVASEQLPFLSERFGLAGKAGNLKAMVEEAQDRFDLDNVFVPDEPMDIDEESAIAPASASRSRVAQQHETVGGLGAPLMDRRAGSRKGMPAPELNIRSRENSLDPEDASFLCSTRNARMRNRPEARTFRTTSPGHDLLQVDLSTNLHCESSNEMASDGPTTPRFEIANPFTRQNPGTSASPPELSPGTHHATDTNQAPSLVSDDGQSGSEYEDDEEDEHDTPKSEIERARINLDDDEIMADPGGPSTISVDDKMAGPWNGKTRRSKSQRQA